MKSLGESNSSTKQEPDHKDADKQGGPETNNNGAEDKNMNSNLNGVPGNSPKEVTEPGNEENKHIAIVQPVVTKTNPPAQENQEKPSSDPILDSH